jgi:hypothetical protein
MVGAAPAIFPAAMFTKSGPKAPKKWTGSTTDRGIAVGKSRFCMPAGFLARPSDDVVRSDLLV